METSARTTQTKREVLVRRNSSAATKRKTKSDTDAEIGNRKRLAPCAQKKRRTLKNNKNQVRDTSTQRGKQGRRNVHENEQRG